MARDLDQMLSADETIVLETRQHWYVVVRRIIQPAIALAVLALALWAADAADWLDNDVGTYLGYALWVLFALVVLAAVWRLLDWWTERLYLTTSKVVYARGILNRDVTSTPFVKIDEVKLARPLLGRMLGFGRLEVENAAGGTEPLAGLQYLPHPIELYREVTDRSRAQRMVEGGAHRDDDADGLVDPARSAPIHAPQPPEDDDRWVPPGESTRS